MPARTSLTHPLEIAEISTKNGGRIGLTFCPGKKQRTALSGAWDRDLRLDLDAVRAWEATAVTLIGDHEFSALAVDDLEREVKARGMAWAHLPIRDVSVPTAVFEAAYDRVSPGIHRRLAAGEAVLVPCKGGLGRAGLVSARLLVETGHAPDEAIALVRSVRPGAVRARWPAQVLRYGAEPRRRHADASVPVRPSGARR